MKKECWLYDLWAGEGAEQGQQPDADVQQLRRRGCIPIESQGDTYFTYLLVTGPELGRVVYIEYERSWIFFPREPDFLSWYIRWLWEAAAGYDMGWFSLSLDGDEETLRKHYIQADTDAERLLAVSSMDKFTALSETSQDFIRRILDEWITKEDVGSLPLLAYCVDPVLYGQLLDKQWEAGLFDQVVYELYHTPAERKDLVKSWRERILNKLSELSPETYCIATPLLRMGGEVKLEQVAFLHDLRGWSAIGRMENLRELRICEICVEDFSFLAECKNLRTLSLYNTNFTDC